MTKKKSKPLVGNNTVGLGYRLSSHERLCAERMKQLIKSIDELKKNVASLNDSMSKGKGAVAVLMALGAFVIGVLGYLNIK